MRVLFNRTDRGKNVRKIEISKIEYSKTHYFVRILKKIKPYFFLSLKSPNLGFILIKKLYLSYLKAWYVLSTGFSTKGIVIF